MTHGCSHAGLVSVFLLDSGIHNSAPACTSNGVGCNTAFLFLFSLLTLLLLNFLYFWEFTIIHPIALPMELGVLLFESVS